MVYGDARSASAGILKLLLMRRILVTFALAASCFAQNRDAELSRLADRYFDEFVFHFDPAQATYIGFHQYDALLASESRAEIDAQIAALKKWEMDIRNF